MAGTDADDNLNEAAPTTGTPFQIGSYRLDHPLGSGGMSSVFLATHTDTGHQVALKVLPRYLAKNSTLLQRFLREAKIAEALEHPNIVAIYDRGTEQGRYYLALEYIAGGDLHDWLRNHGTFPVEKTIEVLRGVARGLAYAAERGLIHRDIKPANILLATDGTPKVADLGLAVQLAEEDERVTRDGTTVGTVDYMSPEQARDSRATSVRSDMYSLGCTIYHLLTGAPPFSGGTVPEKLRRHAQETPPDIRSVRPDVPESLARIVRTLLAKRPERRYPGYPELIAALDAIALPDTTDDVPLVAIIDDDDDEYGVPASDDDLNANYGQRSSSTAVAPRRPPSDRPALHENEVSLAELAALDDSTDPNLRARWGRTRPDSNPAAGSRPGLEAGASAGIPSGGVTLGPVIERRGAGSSGRDLHESIVRGLLLGGAVVILGLILMMVLRNPESTDDEPPAIAATDPGATPSTSSPASPNTSAPGRPTRTPPVPPAQPWTEPAQPAATPTPEPSLPAPLLAAFLPDWSQSGTAPTLPTPGALVSRLPLAGDARPLPMLGSIGAALAAPMPLVEIVDNGPLTLAETGVIEAHPRHLRAAPGRQPIVILSPAQGTLRGASLYTIEGQDVVLEGLHLVVPLADLPASVTSIFTCRGGSLILRQCSVTLIGPANRPVALARLEDSTRAGASPSRLGLDRTFVTGARLTVAEMVGASAEVVLERSVVVLGNAPLVEAAPLSAGNAGRPVRRSLVLVRDVIATENSLLRTAEGATLTVRCLGTTAIHRNSAGSASEDGPLVILEGEPTADITAKVDWAGEQNSFRGWTSWLAAEPQRGSQRQTLVAGLDAARQTWLGHEARSVERPIPSGLPPRLSSPIALAAPLADEPIATATLSRVATPPVAVELRALGRFDRLPAPPGLPAGPPPNGVVIRFDTSSQPDFGKFLASRWASRQSNAVAVRVTGRGRHPMTPVAVPEGISLWIEVDPAAAASDDPPRWFPSPEAPEGVPLLSLQRASLVLRHVQLERPAEAPPSPLVRVADGHIDLVACRLLAGGTDPASRDDRGLVVLNAPTSRPLANPWTAPDPHGPPARADDLDPAHRPWLRLDQTIITTPGIALAADLGRGAVVIADSAMAAGTSAVDLQAGPGIDPRRFQVDLQIDRTTLALSGTGAAVRLAPFTGGDPNASIPALPDRPGLISTRNTVFTSTDPANPASQPGVALLRAAISQLESGRWLWQSDDDVYQLPNRFIAPLSPEPENTPQAGWPASVEEWTAYWGPARIQRPSRGAGASPLVFAAGAIDPATVAFEALQLAPAPPQAGAPDALFTRPTPPPPTTSPSQPPPSTPASRKPTSLPQKGGQVF